MNLMIFSYLVGFCSGVIVSILIQKAIKWIDDYLLKKNEEAGHDQ